MCGICGIAAEEQLPADALALVERMLERLAHRGPDGRGVWHDESAALGHARLSIIDLEGGRQPLSNEDGTVTVVFNGEIYNFAEIRRDLLARGHRFRTNSDTEVLVHLWEDDGPELLSRLRGMFAFVLWDSRQKIVFGARDRFGQKPLYYHRSHGQFAFASEIKSLLALPHVSRELDAVALDQFLFYQFVPHPRTLFEGIAQLPPAHWFMLHRGDLLIERYWELERGVPEQGSDTAHLERVESAVADAVESHMVSDVPVGVLLSGGIDSSLVAALAMRHTKAGQPLKSFSVGFPDPRYDESEYAVTASRHLGTEHHAFRFEPSDLEAQITSFVRTFDQPIGDSAALPLLLLSQETAREVKVALTGDGGDELFAGYDKYRQAVRVPQWAKWLDRSLPELFSSSELARCTSDTLGLRRLRTKIARTCLPEKTSSYFKHFWQGWERDSLYQPEMAERVGRHFEAVDARFAERIGGHALDRMLRVDEAAYLPDDLLLKTDLSTMAYGLESRAPFLDHQLAAVAASLPRHLKATPRETKVALRRIAEKLLPAELVSRPKRGFGVPLTRWFRQDLKSWVRSCLVESSVTADRYFRRPVVERLLAEHESGKRNAASKIFNLLVFELWHREYMR